MAARTFFIILFAGVDFKSALDVYVCVSTCV